jgi:hypothetical protein
MNFNPEILIIPAVMSFGYLVYWVATRKERGGAIDPSRWKCQFCFKNIDIRAKVCRYCGASADRHTQILGSSMKPPIDTRTIVTKPPSNPTPQEANKSENSKLISCSKCRLLHSSALTQCPFCKTQL